MIFFVFSFVFSDECNLNNTLVSDGKCVCKHGYVTDDSFTEHGCWICPNKCHSLAKCQYPGYCECSSGYFGDAHHSCLSPLPNDIAISSCNPLPDGGYRVNISYTKNGEFKVSKAYCMIGSSIYPSIEFDDSIVTCMIPMSIYGNVSISISFDMLNWPHEHLNMNLDKTRNQTFFTESFPFIAFLSIIVLIGSGMIHGKKLCFEEEEENQMLPVQSL